MKAHLSNLGLALLAVFAPIQPMLAAALGLVIVDLITGIIAAKKRGEAISSSGIKRTVGKLVLYELALCVAFVVEHYLTGALLPVSKIVAALVGLTELKSILENLDSISGDSFFKSLINRIVQAQDDASKK